MNEEWKNKPYNEFLDIVKERIDKKLKVRKPFCPYCKSKKVLRVGQLSTLVGGSRGEDPNHHWDSYECSNCNKKFTMEYIGIGSRLGFPIYNVWYTDENHKILAGLPMCYESYIYTCSRCEGNVIRHYFDKGTRNEATILTDVIGNIEKRSYDIVFKCEKCGIEKYSSNKHFTDYNPHEPLRELRINWKIEIEQGPVLINDYALDVIGTNLEKE